MIFCLLYISLTIVDSISFLGDFGSVITVVPAWSIVLRFGSGTNSCWALKFLYKRMLMVTKPKNKTEMITPSSIIRIILDASTCLYSDV